jgi:hypothetical protein
MPAGKTRMQALLGRGAGRGLGASAGACLASHKAGAGEGRIGISVEPPAGLGAQPLLVSILLKEVGIGLELRIARR